MNSPGLFHRLRTGRRIRFIRKAANGAVDLYTGFTDLLFAWKMLGYDAEHWAGMDFIVILSGRVKALSKDLERASGDRAEQEILAAIWVRADEVLGEIGSGVLTGDRFAVGVRKIVFAAAWTWWHLKKQAGEMGHVLVPGNSAIEPIEGVLSMLGFDPDRPLEAKDLLRRFAVES